VSTLSHFKDMRVEEIMVSPVTCAYQSSSLKEIMDQLVVYQFQGLPILDNSENLIGMISVKDIVRAISQGKEPAGTTAKEVMTNNIISAEKGSTVFSLIKVMVENEITRVPICNEGKILGIICQSDIVKNAIEPGIRHV